MLIWRWCYLCTVSELKDSKEWEIEASMPLNSATEPALGSVWIPCVCKWDQILVMVWMEAHHNATIVWIHFARVIGWGGQGNGEITCGCLGNRSPFRDPPPPPRVRDSAIIAPSNQKCNCFLSMFNKFVWWFISRCSWLALYPWLPQALGVRKM